MVECSVCGTSEEEISLFDVISKEGVIKICEACSKREKLPIIKKPTTFQLKESERTSSIYERLARLAGIKYDKAKIAEKTREFKKHTTSLRELIEQNYKPDIKKEQMRKEQAQKPELIDNFHWHVMRARRARKITQKQLAKEIQESESAIKMIEQGMLPKDSYALIKKLEDYLGIKISKDTNKEQPKQFIYEKKLSEFEKPEVQKEKNETLKKLSFEPETAKALTIADLKKMRLNKKEEVSEEKELSEEEIDDILFGGK